MFLDLAKAFDTVSHKRLIEKVEKIGIRGIALNIIKNYLKDRQQYVRINNKLSNSLITKTAVPQGTVLGPILFLIYINSLFKINSEIKIVSYADDTVLLFHGDNWESTVQKASIGLSTVRMWLDKNLLTLNYQKTKFIGFSISSANCNNINNVTLHSNSCMLNELQNCACDRNINAVKEIKYLGVIVDQHLRWKSHIELISKKIRTLIPIFYQLRNILHQKQLISVYKALAESIIRYAITCWGGLYDNVLNMLQVTQNYIIKVMLKKPKMYSTQRLYDEKMLLNIRLIYVLQSITFIHTKFQKQLLQHTANTRTITNNHIKQQFFTKTTCQKFVSFLGTKFYNIIPNNIRKIHNLKTFNYKTKLYVIENKHRFMQFF